LRATAVVGQMTLISRILGLVRDAVIAAVFGASEATDAFFVAFKIPNLFRRLFAEGAFSQAFVPVLATYKANSPLEDVRRLLDAVTTALGGILLCLTLAGSLGAPLVITVVAPGFVADPGKFALSVDLLRVTFPFLFFIALTALLAGVLNTYGKFAIPAFTPALLNVALIGSALLLAPRLPQPIYALAWGVMIGGILQLILVATAAYRAGLFPRVHWDWRHPGVQRILVLMAPAVFGVSVAQLNFLVDTLIASFLREGSISWLYFSDRLMEFPLGIFGIALGTVILPSLSEYHAGGRQDLFSDTLDWALRVVLLITLPAAAGLAALAGPILSTLFQYGQMTEFDVVMSARSLVTYALGLSGFIFVKVLAPGFFSRQDIRTPVKIGIVALLSNLALNLVLVWPLQHAGLALATSLAAFINAGLLLRTLLRTGVFRPKPGWGPYLGKVLAAASVMAVAVHLSAASIAHWSAWGASARVLHLALLIGLGIVVFVGACLLLRLRPRDLAQPRATI
jgi:putative peptidoglycan lipid II flippase